MSLELYLIGTLHYDFRGPARLQKIFPIISPDIISVEYDQQTVIRLDFIERCKLSAEGMQSLVAHFCRSGDYNPETVRQFIPILDFEYFVAKEYCRQKQKPLIFSDLGDPFISQQHLHYALSNPPEQLQQGIETTYQNPYFVVPPEMVPNLLKRDAYTETLLRSLSGRVIHLSGAAHLFGNYHNLYERLRDLNPTRIMLNQADYLYI